MAQESRSLRSNKQPQSSDDEKFDFDVDEYEIDPHKILKTVNRGYPKAIKADKSGIEDVAEKRKLIGSMILEVQRNCIGCKDNTKEDTLPDELYWAYHKKMTRHEARMLESDVIQGENEADKLSLWSEKLDLAHWQLKLKQITVIKNSDDEEEMEKKRVLTKETIDSMLARYHTMKKNRSILLKNNRTGKIDPVKHWSQIYNRINRRMVLDYHSSSDEEENTMDIDQIRAHRKHIRERQCRGSIIIQLTMAACSCHTKYAIIAEPLRRPYVIRISKQERHRWNKLMQQAPGKFTNYTQFPSQVALPKRKVVIPLTINGGSSEKVSRPNSDSSSNISDGNAHAPIVGNKKQSLDALQVEIRTLPVKRVKRK
ncbi:ZYRO0C03938p [Zygosaccharomyces rouxii]|uniref:ZYRO0C03938p n=1 Tax=Zygosaccharomyces rouxii (strain ATCC 2623 / CBS 732 / NBRC 1130 / NCYC 568 / NRRL Y-229) TaxID=559307 RepID=C5DSY4_ZYGRC|nr:uncharacterized protein ZYRO0C03938g [Zygosaccharomyces rouxii]KAH9201916.1 something about silencing, SAS, complex subunit 4-domain-containing protein [Zygosaccharomyces rouxii]CAR26895.1 ZYRO0C03938p [Zygosaccharomyces rouxii]